MTQKSPRDIKYYFPLLAPMLLVSCYVIFEMLTKVESIKWIHMLNVTLGNLLFCFVSIDIWGITTSVTKKENPLILKWVLVMLFHLFLFSVAIYCWKEAYGTGQSTGLTWDTLIITFILFAFGFLALFYAREQTWKIENT
jgi:hypothetical protein